MKVMSSRTLSTHTHGADHVATACRAGPRAKKDSALKSLSISANSVAAAAAASNPHPSIPLPVVRLGQPGRRASLQPLASQI